MADAVSHYDPLVHLKGQAMSGGGPDGKGTTGRAAKNGEADKANDA